VLTVRCIACTDCNDAACCYRCSVICVSVCLPNTTANPTKRLNRSRCCLGRGRDSGGAPRNHVLSGASGSPCEIYVWGRHLRCGLRQNSSTTMLSGGVCGCLSRHGDWTTRQPMMGDLRRAPSTGTPRRPSPGTLFNDAGIFISHW